MLLISHKSWFVLKWILFISASIVWIVGILVCTYLLHEHKSDFVLIILLILLPFGIVSILTFLNLAFPLPYSALGKLQKSPYPTEKPYSEINRTWVKISSFFQSSCPTVTWSFYHKGLGICILGIWRVFLPWESITTIETNWLGALCYSTHQSRSALSYHRPSKIN